MISVSYAYEQSNLQEQTCYGLNTDTHKKFFCPEESCRYSSTLEQLVFNKLKRSLKFPKIFEFGSGSGEPVISALMNSGYLGTVEGYEINRDAVEAATTLIEKLGLSRQYKVHHESFFAASQIAEADYIIANPPYIPAISCSELTLPDLCGGQDGTDISKRLISTGCQNIFLLVSSYSNPKGLLNYATNNGYKITDFQITKMSFGPYSKQDIVQNRILEMKTQGKAFFSNNCYLVGGALFTKEEPDAIDLSTEFEASLTCLS